MDRIPQFAPSRHTFYPYARKCLAAFRRLRRKRIKSVFSTDMCGRKNTSQRTSVRAQASAWWCAVKLKKGAAFFEE
jgi:hypothetical protein